MIIGCGPPLAGGGGVLVERAPERLARSESDGEGSANRLSGAVIAGW